MLPICCAESLWAADTPSTSYAFLLPQWGGIVIQNPPPGYLNNDKLPAADLHSVFSSFSKQLLALLGVPPLPHEITHSTADRASPLSDWQLDALIRRRALENAQGSQDTLQSIVKLVDQIENMPVGEDVRDDIRDALLALANVCLAPFLSLSPPDCNHRCMNPHQRLSAKPSSTQHNLLVLPLARSSTLGC